MVKSLLAVALLASGVAPSPIALPGGDGAIGFDDLRYSEEMHRLLVPAGRTGRLDLVDTRAGAIRSIRAFRSSGSRSRGHEDGTTSADVGQGSIFAIDRTDKILAVIDPASGRIAARAPLEAGPDYVRWNGVVSEVWVTEPGRQVIETFRVERGAAPRLTRTGTISVPGGPEALAVDPARRRAYTNTFRNETVAIDVDARTVTARWPNECRGARGIDLDAARGLAFVGCEEGKVVSLDVARDGRVAGVARTGKGVDGIAYGARLGHLYVPAGDSANLAVIGVGARGELELLGTVATAPGAHCVATDDAAGVYVCNPAEGRLLVFRDPYPASAGARPAR